MPVAIRTLSFLTLVLLSLHPRSSVADADSGLIRGICTVRESATNPFSGSCVNLLLMMNDASGIEAAKSRTTLQGRFEFNVEQGKIDRLISGSKYYEVVLPKDEIRGGSQVSVQLQQR